MLAPSVRIDPRDQEYESDDELLELQIPFELPTANEAEVEVTVAYEYAPPLGEHGDDSEGDADRANEAERAERVRW